MPDPLTKPIASQRAVRRMVRQYANLLGFAHPFRICVAFHDSRKENYCDPDDKDCYGYCQAQPQYHRAILGFDLYHPRWMQQDETIEECIRHELAHAFVAFYTQAAMHLTGEKEERMRKILNDLEDELVQRIATMPVWNHASEA